MEGFIENLSYTTSYPPTVFTGYDNYVIGANEITVWEVPTGICQCCYLFLSQSMEFESGIHFTEQHWDIEVIPATHYINKGGLDSSLMFWVIPMPLWL